MLTGRHGKPLLSWAIALACAIGAAAHAASPPRLYERGELLRAIDRAERSLAHREATLGARDPSVAAGLGELAALYMMQGAYARAEPLLARALDLRVKNLGEMHPDVARSLDELAALYLEQGAYAKAESLLTRSLEIRRKLPGPIQLDAADSLGSLAVLYLARGEYARAERFTVDALRVREHALGARHPLVAASLSNLASVYDLQGKHEAAAPLYLRALDIRKKALGEIHPEVANTLNNLAQHYRLQGAYEKAELLYARALAIHEQTLGARHPLVATSLLNLAALYRTQGRHARAEPLARRAADIREEQLRLELERLSEPRKRALMALLQDETESVVSLHADEMPTSPRALDLALTTVLRRKSRVLDSLTDNQAKLYARVRRTPVLRDRLNELAAASSQLSTLLRAPVDGNAVTGHAAAIARLRAYVDELQSALNAASAEFRRQSEPVTIARVQAALPRGAALVEFVRYHRDVPQDRSRGQARYVAYVLPWRGEPQAVMLGEAASIDAGVDEVLAAMRKGIAVDRARAALRNLDARLFDPLRRHLTATSHLILSPDGELNLVPFEALLDPAGHYELEQRLVSYVTSGRDLLRLEGRRNTGSSVTIVAAPDYGAGPFHAFDGALAEITTLTASFPAVHVLTGKAATKSALADLDGPAVLHIATHGFYARGHAGPFPAPRPPRWQRGLYLEADPFASLPALASTEDPTDALDRAGLALADANVGPDGIVTARELASYDWWGAQLVVLSACQTGVGAVPSGEGVYGMRRALVLAGAESHVVSLWNVNDSSTAEMMKRFYGELARGTGRAEALRRAKLQLLQQVQFAHPYYWAAFIAAGNWTPLDPSTLTR